MRSMLLIAMLCVMPGMASAADASPTEAAAPTTIAIPPIFGQLVRFTLPPGFATIFEQPTTDKYIREAVLTGETADRWSQMITVTGVKGNAQTPQMAAEYFAAQIAAGFQKSCPATFTVKPLGSVAVGGEDAFAAVSSCGKVDASVDKHSETALIVAIKGEKDLYTIQWAERTPSNAENLTIDESKWKARLQQISPVRVCAILADEKPPYPSCTNK